MRILLSGLCFTLALLLGAVPAAWAELTVCSSGCDVPNIVDADRTWAAGAYRVQEHIQVHPGVTLTLEPGVTLRFTTHEMGLQVGGTLIARGTAEQRITFTSDKTTPAPEDWGTILFTETAVGASFDAKGSYVSGSIFERCVVEYAGGGAAQGAIWVQSPRAPYVYKSTIRNNGVSGMRLVGPPKAGGGNEGVQEARVRESEISGNSASGYGGGIYVSVASSGVATLSGNTLSGNSASGYGGGIYLSVASSGVATLSGNTLSGNSTSYDGGGGGIYLSSSGVATLSGNTLSGNSASGYDEGYGGGIYLSVASSGTATLSGNTLSRNSANGDNGGYGGGIYLSSSGTATLSGNTLSGNSASGDGYAGSGGYGGGIYVSVASSGVATLS
ncbi:MAG: right-handed parallel beta-helix repeat-containing protein, partial [Chloroflexi bacterium]|nr:right-handed parallel beta-helix repeat-containing protein [Chloroflexota bacterium]